MVMSFLETTGDQLSVFFLVGQTGRTPFLTNEPPLTATTRAKPRFTTDGSTVQCLSVKDYTDERLPELSKVVKAGRAAD